MAPSSHIRTSPSMAQLDHMALFNHMAGCALDLEKPVAKNCTPGPGVVALGDDGIYVLGRCHVEGGILNGHAVRGHLLSGDVRDFLDIALLDGNFASVGAGEVDGGNWRGHVERYAVLFGQYSDGIRS